ncbi:ribonuclease toxin immunity protein CdiI [Pseudomonas aeruginosa]|nr:ribonuclease toxin immunity protein CdiI [Pseudomonas aeruginosa]
MAIPPKDEDTIVVSEAVCSKFIRLACEKYLQRHPVVVNPSRTVG